MEKAAALVSAILQPSATAILLYAYLYYSYGSPASLALGLAASLLPLLYTLSWARSNDSPWDLPRRSLRSRPLLAAFLANAAAVLLLILIGSPRLYVAVAASYALGSLAAYLVSKRVKVSLHVLNAASTAVGFYYAAGPAASAVFWSLVPLVAWSRIRLGRHTPSQILLGAAMGTLLAFSVFEALA